MKEWNMKFLAKGLGGGILLVALTVLGYGATEMEDRLAVLEARQKALEEKWAAQPVVVAGVDGFSLKSADGAFGIRFFGDIQLDGRYYVSDKAGSFTDTFLLRRLRPGIEMNGLGIIKARFQPNFAGSSPSLDDGYFDVTVVPAATFRFGRYKPPVGLENLQSSTRTTFMERGLPTNLIPGYDEGAQIHGVFSEGRVSYAVSVSNGSPDGAGLTADRADGKTVSARLFIEPLKGSSSFLRDLGVGLAETRGREDGTPLPAGFKTEGQNTFFTYTNAVAKGKHQRLTPQMYWYGKNVGLLGEYVVSSQEVQHTGTQEMTHLANTAWQMAFSYVLTGEKPSYTGVKPKTIFDPAHGTWGAVECTARVSRFTTDEEAFEKDLADPTVSAREARAWTGGVNWYPNVFLKMTINYTYTAFSGGAVDGRRVPENALFLRSQIAF
jgi:phosphate-selective porin OprO/OprP